MKKTIGIIFILFFLFSQYIAQNTIDDITFNGQAWKVSADEYSVEKYKGKEALILKDGAAVIQGAKLKNGIIEFDIAFAEKRQFSGIMFRMVDYSNYEELYLRPHQSGNPDANQYTPVFYGNASWQLYHGQGHGTPYKYKFDEWMHVKILLKDDQAEFYIDNMETPIFRTIELKRSAASGEIGFKSSMQKAYFANLSYTQTDDVTLKLDPYEREEVGKNVIKSYQVSQIIQEKSLLDKTTLSKSDIEPLVWKTLKTEYNGTLNLSQVGQRSREDNTVFVKLEIDADSPEIRQLEFGYSDRVRVFCNSQIIYSGHNEFVSRDYRYLGTIGYFDSAYLPLKKGKNEILIAVSENFGGWGIKARLK